MVWEKEKRILFGNHLGNTRSLKKITQKDLAKMINNYLTERDECQCKERFNQRKISQIETGDRTKYLPTEVLDALMSLELIHDQELFLASPENISIDSWLHISNTQYILTSASSQEIKHYLGEYHCVFKSTETKKEDFLRCKMSIFEAEDGTCNVSLELPVVEANECKRYSGKFFINHHFDTCYAIMCDSRWQEVSMLIAPWFKASIHRNKLLTPLVLTTSAGENKRPTVHRMLISRDELKGEVFELAKSQLLLNTDSIQITEEQLSALENLIMEKLKSDPKSEYYSLAKKFCEIIKTEGTRETVIRIEEARLFDIESYCENRFIRSKATALVRLFSEGVYHNKIGKSGPKLINALIDLNDK